MYLPDKLNNLSYPKHYIDLVSTMLVLLRFDIGYIDHFALLCRSDMQILPDKFHNVCLFLSYNNQPHINKDICRSCLWWLWWSGQDKQWVILSLPDNMNL